MNRLFPALLASFGLVLVGLPLASAQDPLSSDRMCSGSVDYDCTDYYVVCETYWSNCHKEPSGRYCAVFTTFPPDITLPETKIVCRHETYGEPPVDE